MNPTVDHAPAPMPVEEILDRGIPTEADIDALAQQLAVHVSPQTRETTLHQVRVNAAQSLELLAQHPLYGPAYMAGLRHARLIGGKR